MHWLVLFVQALVFGLLGSWMLPMVPEGPARIVVFAVESLVVVLAGLYALNRHTMLSTRRLVHAALATVAMLGVWLYFAMPMAAFALGVMAFIVYVVAYYVMKWLMAQNMVHNHPADMLEPA